MSLRSIGIHTLGSVLLTLISLNSSAQVAGKTRATSATNVAAEMTRGKLNPSESKPGDKVAVRLKDDVRSNGEVVLRRGTTITGVVRGVKRAAKGGKPSGRAQSMMEIEWFAPDAEGKAAQQLSIALQSVSQVNPLYQQPPGESPEDDFGFEGEGGSGLPDGAAGSAPGMATSAQAGARSNAALLNMPSVIAVDSQTSEGFESAFGTLSPAQLFKVGRGDLVSPGGLKQSVDLFSHLSNDTLITSSSKSFEISSGAQMQLLVGVNQQ